MILIEVYRACDGTELSTLPVYRAKSVRSVCQDKLSQLAFVPFPKWFEATGQENIRCNRTGEYPLQPNRRISAATEQENIASRYNLTVHETHIDGRKVKALPYFTWYNCISTIFLTQK